MGDLIVGHKGHVYLSTKFSYVIDLYSTYRGADKSLARPTSRCLMTESIVSLEVNLLLRSNNICLLQTFKNL